MKQASFRSRILCFAGDPGAANLIRYFPELVGKDGPGFDFFADEDVIGFLSNRQVSAKNGSFMDWDALLRDGTYQAVLVGSSANRKSNGLDLIKAARKTGIPSIGVVDAMMSASIRYAGESNDPLAFAPDWLLVVNEETRQAYVDTGFDPGKILLTGQPHYQAISIFAQGRQDFARNAGRHEGLGLARESARRILLFVAEPEIPEENITPLTGSLRGDGTSTERCHIALQELIGCLKKMNCRDQVHLVLRLHPKNDPADFVQYDKDIDFVSSGGNSMPLVCDADAIVGITSSLLLEAAFSGNPCLSLISREADARELPADIKNRITCIYDSSTLEAAVKHILEENYPQSNNSCKPEAVDSGTLLSIFFEDLCRQASTAEGD